ncbi:MAG: glycoside hydrolase family 3 C-terminal domain-containing protein, partial [Chloroflexota bacterium]|nr:glycoside hydrolase family 3 C-terminal domain-containing protein [Chloroflexota bacterium]
DPIEAVPYAHIPIAAVDSPANQALALEVARQSLVLLKNENHLLPLNKNLDRIAVIGPNADDALVLRGNYYGTPSESVTILEGIREILSPSTSVQYARGCEILASGKEGFDEAVRIAEEAALAIMVMGLSQQVEGEEGQSEGLGNGLVSQGDREDLRLPGEQEALLKAVVETGTPVVLVLINGSALAINWADEHVPAILEAWYPGQAGGRAVAEVLFGDSAPGGKLPVTFYRSVEQLPPFEDYTMAGRTYRYFDGDVLYPFGYGLSYTHFEYQHLTLSQSQIWGSETVQISCAVKNAGEVHGDEVVQVYLRDNDASLPVPRHHLVGFKRVHLGAGATETLTFSINPKQFALADENGDWIIEKGSFTIFVGGGQPGTAGVLTAHVEMLGETIKLA